MKFTDFFGITPGPGDDWFDPILTADTRLFVDPFAIYSDADERWETAHAHLIEFFNLVLGLVAQAGLRSNSPHWKAAQRLLKFPEPAEFCLGYGETPLGSGTGSGFGGDMLQAAVIAIREGVTEVSHFEELALFSQGIGADRISDIVCNVLKSYFIDYTREVAERHGVDVQDVPVRHADWSAEFTRWEDEQLPLPVNPWTEKGVLLVPARFLRPLPTVLPRGVLGLVLGVPRGKKFAGSSTTTLRRTSTERRSPIRYQHRRKSLELLA